MSRNDNRPSAPLDPQTELVTSGRDTVAQKGFINPPIVRGSTVLYPTAEDLHAHRGEFQYGRHGTPTTRALQDVMMALEGPQCAGVGIAPSGLAAISTTLMSVTKAGDHILVCDNVYRPSRNFCNGVLARYGVETTYFDPKIGAAIEALFKPNTRAVLVEAPGSQSFEMPDIPAIVEVAHARGALVAVDNTFATPLLQQPLVLGADVVMHSATKYFGGHSDVMGGALAFARRDELAERVLHYRHVTGGVLAPFNAWLILRGLRSMPARLAWHCRNARAVAEFLASRPEVERVNWPGLPGHANHAVAKAQMRDFGGMLSVEMRGGREAALRLASRLKLFTNATSLGGVESLVEHRASVEGEHPHSPQSLLRFSVGLEHPDDLVEDLRQGLAG